MECDEVALVVAALDEAEALVVVALDPPTLCVVVCVVFVRPFVEAFVDERCVLM